MTVTDTGIVKLAINKYEIRVRATCPRTNRRKEVRRVQECTLTEARALQRQWQDELTTSLHAEPRTRQRLADFAASWLRGRIEAGELKTSSADKIAVVWDLHIATSDIAHLYTDDITTADVKAWIDHLRAKLYVPGKGKATGRKTRSDKSKARPYSRTTIRGYYRVLRTILNAAGAGAACAGVGRLKGKQGGHNVLRAEELASVLAIVKVDSPAWYPAILLDAFCGLRWGELSALRWSDVDEANGVIRVERGNYKGEVVESTKTGDDEDRRAKVVPLLPEVAEVLRERRKAMVKKQHPGLAEGWIFPTEKGTLHCGSPLRDVLDAACKKAEIGRRFTAHGLRHTANDLLRRVASGEVVRAILGHTTEQMTHHYSHIDEGEKREAAMRAFAVVTGGAGVAKGVEKGVATRSPDGANEDPKMENPAIAGPSVGGATQI